MNQPLKIFPLYEDDTFDEISSLIESGKVHRAALVGQTIASKKDLTDDQKFTLARVHYEIGQYQKAMQMLDRIIEPLVSHSELKIAIYTAMDKWPLVSKTIAEVGDELPIDSWIFHKIFAAIDEACIAEERKVAEIAIIAVPEKFLNTPQRQFTAARAHYVAGCYEDAGKILDTASFDTPEFYALRMANAARMRRWVLLRKLFREHFDRSQGMGWVLNVVEDELVQILGQSDFKHADQALLAFPDTIAVPNSLRLQFARIHYENNRPAMALEILDTLLVTDGLHAGLLMVCLSARGHWSRLKTTLADYSDLVQDMPWVTQRIFKNLSDLVQAGDFKMAKEALDAISMLTEVPPESLINVARLNYEAGNYEVVLDHLDQNENAEAFEVHALEAAATAGLQKWNALKPKLTRIDPSRNENKWVFERLYVSVEQLVQDESFETAVKVLKFIPDHISVPGAQKFSAARAFYETGNYDKAGKLLEYLPQGEPKHLAFRLAILIRKEEWSQLNQLTENLEPLDVELNWVFDPLWQTVESLVDKNEFGEAYQAVRAVPSFIGVPIENSFTWARVYYEAGDYETARGYNDRLDQDEPQVKALGMAIRAGLQDWDGLESALKAGYDPNGDMDWVLERIYSEISQSEFGKAGPKSSRIEQLIVENFFDTAPISVKMKLLASLTQAGRYERVIALAEGLRSQVKNDKTLMVVIARAAYLRRKWDQDLEIFSEYRKRFETSHPLYEKIKSAQEVGEMISTKSTLSAEEVDGRVNDRIFDVYFRTAQRKEYKPAGPRKVAMIGANMAAGGAEHVLINAHLGMNKVKSVNNSMWLHNIDEHLNNNHFLKEYSVEIGRSSSTYIMAPAEKVIKPFSWIGGYIGHQANKVYNRILKAKPAVIHAWQDSTNIEVAMAAIKAGVPKIILHPHNMQPDLVHKTEIAKSFWACYRALLSRNDVHLVCCSEASLNDYLRWLNRPRTKNCHVVYNGFNWSDDTLESQKAYSRNYLTKSLGIDPKLKLVCGIFRLNEVKQPLLWAEVAKRVLAERDDTAFVIYGDGNLMPEVKAFVEEHNLQDRFFLPGRVLNATKHSAACDMLLHTSRTEGLPTVLIEAMTNGLPVVGANVGGSCETFGADNKDMFTMIDGFDPDEYASEVHNMLNRQFSEQDRLELSEKTKAKFSVESMVDALTKIYFED